VATSSFGFLPFTVYPQQHYVFGFSSALVTVNGITTCVLTGPFFRRMRLLPSHASWDLSHASTSVACVLCHMELSELERMAWQGHGDPLLSPLRLLAPQDASLGHKTPHMILKFVTSVFVLSLSSWSCGAVLVEHFRQHDFLSSSSSNHLNAVTKPLGAWCGGYGRHSINVYQDERPVGARSGAKA
jgi:hypothetical protein